MRRLGTSVLILLGAVAMAFSDTGQVAAQSGAVALERRPLSVQTLRWQTQGRWRTQGERIYRGHYFNWQQSYDGRIFAWMSRDTYSAYVNTGLGAPASGPYTVTAGNAVYNGSYAGQSAPGGLVLVELRRRMASPPTQPQPPQPQQPQGCPPGDTYWNVYAQADEGYNYQFKVVIRSTGEAVYVMWSGDRMTWVEATGRVSGNQLVVNAVASVTDDRGQLVKVGGSLRATLKPGCAEGEGRTESGRVPGLPNQDGNVRVERYG